MGRYCVCTGDSHIINCGNIPLIYIHLWPSHLPFAYQFIFNMMTYKNTTLETFHFLLSCLLFFISPLIPSVKSMKTATTWNRNYSFLQVWPKKSKVPTNVKFEFWISAFILEVFLMMIKKKKLDKPTIGFFSFNYYYFRAGHFHSLSNQRRKKK